jgi:hypothetical protein
MYTKFVAYMINLALEVRILRRHISLKRAILTAQSNHWRARVVCTPAVLLLVAGQLLNSCPRNRRDIRPVSPDCQACRGSKQARVLLVERTVPLSSQCGMPSWSPVPRHTGSRDPLVPRCT